jgi:hypothetical protein
MYLNFIGQTISDNPEYVVAKHLLTPYVTENPAQTMGLLVSDEAPSTDNISVKYEDHYYTLKPETGYQWNREGFRLLSQIFQMTMTDLARQGAPGITISK